MTSCIKRSAGMLLIIFVCVIFFALPAQQAHASELVPEWTQNHGGSETDEFLDSTVTEDGRYIVAVGTTTSAGAFGPRQGLVDAIAVCVDKEGNLVWSKNFGGSSTSYFYAVAIAGNYVYAAGVSDCASTNLGLNNWGNEGTGSSLDAIVVKLNLSDGSVVWAKNYGGVSWDYFSALAATDTALYAAGYSAGVSTNLPTSPVDLNWNFVDGYDGIIVKINPASGEALWSNNYGGPDFDYFDAIAVAGDYIYAAGSSRSISTNLPSNNWGNEGSDDGIVVKVDANSGVAVWGRNYGGLDPERFEALATSSDGSLYAAGSSVGTGVTPAWGNEGSGDAIVLKINSDTGVPIWSNNYGGPADDNFVDLFVASDVLYAAGSSYGASTNITSGWSEEWHGDGIVVAINLSTGVANWGNNYGGFWADRFSSLSIASDGSMYIAGTSYAASTNLTPHNWGNAGDGDGIIVKFASNNPPVDPTDPVNPTDPTNPSDNGSGLAKTADDAVPLASIAVIAVVTALVLLVAARLCKRKKDAV